MAKHTPTPWCVEDPMGPDQLWIVEVGKETYEWRCIAIVASDDPINDEDRDPVEPVSMAEMKANAAFIVKAVNAHDALVKALSEALAVIQDCVGYSHSGDPWEENAFDMGELDIHDYARDGRLEKARTLLAAVGGVKGD